MQPGKPQALGRVGGAAYLGFPGNPVSSLVSWIVFGRPLLRAMAGARPTVSPAVGILAVDVQPMAARQRYVRARLTPAVGGGPVGVVPVEGYGSHLVGGLGETDCFLEIPPGSDAHDAGTPVRILSLEGS